MRSPYTVPSWIIAVITVALLVILAWQVGSLVADQRQIIEAQAAAAEAAEQRADRIVEMLLAELRSPDRLRLFENVETVESKLDRVIELLEERP